MVAVETMIVAGLPSPRRPNLAARVIRQPLMMPLILGVVPWMVYALVMWELNRQNRPDGDITVGVDHYSVQGAAGLAALALVVVAAFWPPGRLLMGTCAGLAAIYLGVVSWAWHPTPGSFNQTWSAICIFWGIVVIMIAALTRPTHTAGF